MGGVVARPASEDSRRPMLTRFLFDEHGRVRVPRMIGTIAAGLVFALFGTFLLALTPVFEHSEGAQTLWVLFVVFVLKFPLVALLSWFILRNKEWPTKPPKWDQAETREILAYLVKEADRALPLPDARARLTYLQGEAWNVADKVGGDVKVDAVDVALHIDQLLTRPELRRAPH
jgi:hypothetical protein